MIAPFGPVPGYERAYMLMDADRRADGAYASAIAVMETGGPRRYLRQMRPTAVRVCAGCIAEGDTRETTIRQAMVRALGVREDVMVLARLMAERLGAPAGEE